MTISLVNYKNISSDTGQDKTERPSLWRVAISILTLYKIKLNDSQYGELKKIVLTTKKIKLNGSQYGELQK